MRTRLNRVAERTRGLWAAAAAAWLLLTLGAARAAARPDLVFRVPEVLVRTAAAPRAVGTGPSSLAARGNLSTPVAGAEGGGALDPAEFYYVEHEVSTADARRAAQMLQLSDVVAPPGCGRCARRSRQYCADGGALADHCCCERRFLPEPLPWMPHACRVAARRCRPRAPSCAHAQRLRDCCCLPDLARHWKSILSGAGDARAARSVALAAAALLAALAAL